MEASIPEFIPCGPVVIFDNTEVELKSVIDNFPPIAEFKKVKLPSNSVFVRGKALALLLTAAQAA